MGPPLDSAAPRAMTSSLSFALRSRNCGGSARARGRAKARSAPSTGPDEQTRAVIADRGEARLESEPQVYYHTSVIRWTRAYG